MTRIITFLCFLISFASYSQQVEVVKFDKLESLLKAEKEKVTVINFWATWCAPCIKEMPYFEEIRSEYDVDVVLVSLDFIEKLDKVKAFAEKKNLKSRVLLLDDVDYNSWIDKVEPRWSGAIPATLILDNRSKERVFIGQETSKEELVKSLNKFINP